MNFSNTTYRVVFLSALIWCLFILSAPVALHLEATSFAHTVYGSYSRICHQLDSHSLHLFGAKLAVCARCTAIYFGFFAGVLLYPLYSRKRRSQSVNRLLLLTSLPLLIDVFLNVLGINESTLFTRIFTGAIFGLSTPLMILEPADEAFNELRLKLPLLSRRKIRHAE